MFSVFSYLPREIQHLVIKTVLGKIILYYNLRSWHPFLVSITLFPKIAYEKYKTDKSVLSKQQLGVLATLANENYTIPAPPNYVAISYLTT